MHKIFSAFVMIAAVSCTGTEKKVSEDTARATSDSTDPVPGPFKDISVDGCYMQILQRDTFVASLQEQEGLVHGKMSFNNYEKDKSSGTVSGRLEADILKLYYTFASEGTTSVMELYFKYRDGNLIRGIGDMNTRGDTAFFVNPAQITYSGDEFKKISCQDLPVKYK